MKLHATTIKLNKHPEKVTDWHFTIVTPKTYQLNLSISNYKNTDTSGMDKCNSIKTIHNLPTLFHLKLFSRIANKTGKLYKLTFDARPFVLIWDSIDLINFYCVIIKQNYTVKTTN